MLDSGHPSHKDRVARGRFAPSPTGLLHLGHAQTMLLSWLQMRALGGQFVLRMEDVDSGRSRLESEAAIYEDLRWLGFDWDEGPGVGGPHEPYRQSERGAWYRECLVRLQDRSFPCSCTRKQIRAVAGGGSGELRYPGTCRSGASPGQPWSTRLVVEPEELRWHDLVLGPCHEDPSAVCGDFILRAKNGDFVYQLACVADDVAMGITHVLRGEDLASSTGRQLLLYRELGAQVPLFAHVPLRRDESGERLAKSRGSPPLCSLRQAGEDPRVVLGRLALDLGLVDVAEPLGPADLIGPFRERRPELCRPA